MPFVLGLMAVNGLGNTAMVTGGQTLLQRLIPNDVLGRALGAVGMLTMLGIALGSAIAPSVINTFGITTSLVALGVGYPTMSLLAWPFGRRTERRVTAHDAERTLLATVPFLAKLPLVALDGCAQNVRKRSVCAGDTIVRQGERGETFFVLASGQADVTVDTKMVRTLGPGGWFGELALLRDWPRTATVTMVADGELIELDRGDLFRALSFEAGNDAASQVPADYVMPSVVPAT